VFSTSVKARVSTSPRDIAYGEDRIVVRWNKTRWRCREDYCERSSFTEAIAQVPARARTTRRLRTQIGVAIGDAARSVAEVAASHGVSWPTAHRAFVAHAEALLGEPQPTPVLGVDETRRGKPRWERCAASGRWVRVDPWDTGFVDLAGDQGLLAQREGRTAPRSSAGYPNAPRPSARASSMSRSIPRPPAPRPSAHPVCCPTPRSWSTTSTPLTGLTRVVGCVGRVGISLRGLASCSTTGEEALHGRSL
jgi:hypothetical protein